MRQGDIWLMEPPFEVARPVIVISRNWAISHLTRVVVAPITRTIRSTETIISVGLSEQSGQDVGVAGQPVEFGGR